MVTQSITSLLNRRGQWMTPVEIFDASPDYPLGEYVNADLAALKANGLVVSRPRKGACLTEDGLPTWVNAPEPPGALRYLAYLIKKLLRQLAPAA